MTTMLKAWGTEIPVTLEVTKYRNGTTAITVTDHSEGYPQPYCTLTVNFEEVAVLEEDLAFVDVNNCPWAEEFITDLEIAFPTGITHRSGYVVYPLYMFSLKEIQKYSEV